MTTRLGTRVPDVSVSLGAAILSGGGSPPAPAATMPSTALYLPGTSGNYVSTPDAASLDITGDLCLVACVALDDWTPASAQRLVVKANTSGTRSYEFYVNATTGRLAYFGVHGGGNVSIIGITNLTVSDGEKLWVGMTQDLTGSSTKFWTGGGGDTPSWSLLETAGGTTTARDAGTEILELGSLSSGTLNRLQGSFYYAAVYDGIGANTAPGQGTLVYEADFSHPWVGNRYTDSTGKVSTINGSAWAWEVV